MQSPGKQISESPPQHLSIVYFSDQCQNTVLSYGLMRQLFFSGRRTGHLDGNITTAILLERPLYLANSITCPDQKEAEDIGHLKFMLSR